MRLGISDGDLATNLNSRENKVNRRSQIVEATGWIVDKDGNIEFVAQANRINPQSKKQTASCSVSKSNTK